jgi:hypothetical protein
VIKGAWELDAQRSCHGRRKDFVGGVAEPAPTLFPPGVSTNCPDGSRNMYSL